MPLQNQNQNSLQRAPQAQHHFRPEKGVGSLLMEILQALRAIRSDLRPSPSMKTGVPLSNKEAANELGLKPKQFKEMVDARQLVDGRHYIAMGDSVILVSNVLDLLCEDRLKTAEYAPKPSQITTPKQ